MYLKKLEMQGFKSFADKTTIELMPGITAVIGPNGSGKSNISDAIRWILGEQSMKSLRGTKSQDLVFAGTQNRKSLGYAEASLVFDNTDGTLPIEYSEVTVTRRIYRSGETEVYINKAPCRLKDVLELFMDTGIGKDGYSIIGQGKIDEILSNKSENRRHIFEEAAGIVKYRTRKEESEKKLERTKLNLLRINDILNEIEGSIDPLKSQADKAKKYLDYREELKSIELGLFLYNISKLKTELEEVKENEKIMQDNCSDEEAKLEKTKYLKDELKQKIEEITQKIEDMSNLGFSSQQQIEQLTSDINVANTKIENNNENKERLSKEIEELEKKVKEFNEEINQKTEKKDRLKENKEKFAKELEEKEVQLNKITSSLSEKELEIEGYKQKIEENTDKKYELQSDINTNDINHANYVKREKQLEDEIANSISELDSARLAKSDMLGGFQNIEAKRNKLVEELEKSNKQKEEATKKLKEYENNLIITSNDMRIKESKLKFLIETEKERDGYIKSVKLLLKDCDKNVSLNKGMHGVLANILEVPEKYQTAIEMCLGMALQNIVTDTEEEAKKLIKHLRDNNLGRASFLPISSVKGNKIDRIKGGKDGLIGIASDLVGFEKKYEQIVLNLLGRTVIVDTMDNAIKLAKSNDYKFRIITLDGDVINPSGAITGGAVTKKSVNILGRNKEIEKLEKEVNKLNEKIKEIQKQKNDYEKSINGVIEKAEQISKDLQLIEIEYATEKQKMITIEDQVQKAEERLAKLKSEKEGLKTKKEDCIKNKENINLQLEELSKETEKLRKQVGEYAEANKENQTYIDNLKFDITNLKISVSSFDESEMSIKEMEERIKIDIESSNKSVEFKKKEIGDLEKANVDIAKEIEEINTKISQINNEVNNSDTKIEDLKQQRIDANAKLEEQEQLITDKFNSIEVLKAQIMKLDVKKSKCDNAITDIINKMWEEYELTPNAIQGEYEKPTNVANTQKKVNELRKDIRDLGSVNVDAIQEYKVLKERYDFMCEQRLDLETAMAKLRSVITDMTAIMKKQFKDKFKEINKNFGEVFQELFGGGKANLRLEDESKLLECGIEINVQPPGKKLQNMMLLSGGEKAFTAIALLFAILRLNPAPFCILDEIEAALDDVNVYRYAEYLKKFAEGTQFLIITHRKGTMEAADTVYGVTMEEKGISKLLSMKLN